MTERWKDIFICLILGVFGIFSMSWVTDVLLIDGLQVDKGFLGSILGGMIGTLGVIGTTFFLIEANKTSTKYVADLQDKQIRERDYAIFLIKQIEEVNQVLNQCTRLVYKDVNLMEMVGDALSDLKDFEIFNDIKNINQNDQETKIILLDRHNMFTEKYSVLKKEEAEVRFELIEYLGNLRTKIIFIPEIVKDIDDIEKVINSNAKEIIDFYKGNTSGETIPSALYKEFKNRYLQKERTLKSKLNFLAIDLLDDYKKTP